MDTAELLDWADIQASDRAEAGSLLAAEPGPQVQAALRILRRRWMEIGAPPPAPGIDELAWLHALLRFIPEQLEGYRGRGVPEAVARATLADIGRHVAISRTTNGHFGLETWKWLTEQASGTLFQLGRLHFHLIPGPAGIPGLRAGEKVLGMHIPEAGPLLPGLVQESLAGAVQFFGECFPEHPVRFGHCHSWLLDPYLAQQLPSDSNIVAFANRFTRFGELFDAPGDAVYFTFRTRDMTKLAGLPRESRLQQVVLERIDAGGSWQAAQGYLNLPEVSSP
ncbi:MAG: DUF5596 domain-containing protein [Renibacterium sp.]|nr:DUF5596 domain-containing protein [Renibacterium sp.]